MHIRKNKIILEDNIISHSFQFRCWKRNVVLNSLPLFASRRTFTYIQGTEAKVSFKINKRSHLKCQIEIERFENLKQIYTTFSITAYFQFPAFVLLILLIWSRILIQILNELPPRRRVPRLIRPIFFQRDYWTRKDRRVYDC